MERWTSKATDHPPRFAGMSAYQGIHRHTKSSPGALNFHPVNNLANPPVPPVVSPVSGFKLTSNFSFYPVSPSAPPVSLSEVPPVPQ